jgi:hypothetical protein
MTPEDAWANIKRLQAEIDAAPKVAGPWRKAEAAAYNGCTYEWRDRPLGGTAAWVGPDDRNWDDLHDEHLLGFFGTREEADEALRAAGWLLVDSDVTTYWQDKAVPEKECIDGQEGERP